MPSPDPLPHPILFPHPTCTCTAYLCPASTPPPLHLCLQGLLHQLLQPGLGQHEAGREQRLQPDQSGATACLAAEATPGGRAWRGGLTRWGKHEQSCGAGQGSGCRGEKRGSGFTLLLVRRLP